MRLREKILIDLKSNKNISSNELCLKYFMFPYFINKEIKKLYREGNTITEVRTLGTYYKLIRDKNGKYYW